MRFPEWLGQMTLRNPSHLSRIGMHALQPFWWRRGRRLLPVAWHGIVKE